MRVILTDETRNNLQYQFFQFALRFISWLVLSLKSHFLMLFFICMPTIIQQYINNENVQLFDTEI